MKTKYEDSFKVLECPVCGYKHKEYYRNHTCEEQQNDLQNGFGKDAFIIGETEFLYTEEIDYAPDRLHRETVYACPKCGVLQIGV